jgi:hypothetical protein
MARKDFFVVVSTVAIASLLAYLAGASTNKPMEVLRCENGASHETRAADFTEPFVAVRQRETGKPALDAAGAPKHGSAPRDGGNPVDAAARDPALAVQKQREVGARFSRLIDDGSNADPSVMSAKLESRFYSEEWNREWAGRRERDIRTLFGTDTELNGMAPLQVTCRSRNCQVVLAASSQDEVRLASEKFMRAATRGDVGMSDQVVSFFPDVATGRVVFYLSEGANTDLFQ